MPVAVPNVLLIPYGVSEWSPANLAVAGFSTRTLRLDARFPCAAINRAARTPLRLNNSVYDLAFAPDVQGGATDEAALVRDYVKALCRRWDNVSAQFVDSYFGYVAGLVETHGDELAGRVAPFAGLYDPAHFLFSAPKPLPRAHLYAPPASGPTGDASDFLMVDFAFWLGDRLVATPSAQAALTPRKAREVTDRLALAGIEAVPFRPADLAGEAAAAFFGRVLGPLAPRFWERDVVPAGPFRSSLMDD